jgi:hypothetical protein
VNTTDRITDYQDGYYRIRVNPINSDSWANPRLGYYDTIVEVDTFMVGGPLDNDYGIVCRYVDTQNFYFGVISSDGFAGILHLDNGSYTIVGDDVLRPYPAIVQGADLNHIRFDCIGSTLTLYANGQFLTSVTDTSLPYGDVGLIAGTFSEGGVDIYFDNFTVYLP